MMWIYESREIVNALPRVALVILNTLMKMFPTPDFLLLGSL